ncbi:hypothetical protein CEA52_18410 [Cronobacter sakazakii]|nr:hypothetical protein CEA52_18410 [Cronobacter sakazakii]
MRFSQFGIIFYTSRASKQITQHTRASPGDGLITQSTRAGLLTAGALLCCVEKLRPAVAAAFLRVNR